jgi:hypothetical protein
MTDWTPFENGTSLGATGSEGGTILRDELHPDGARITLERTGSVSPHYLRRVRLDGAHTILLE